MTTENAEAEQLNLIENPPTEPKSKQNASPTKSKSSEAAENGEAMDSLIMKPPDSKSKCKRACYWIIGIFLFCVFAGAVIILAFLILRVGGQAPVVHTTCGKIQGVFNFQKNYFSFMGVPYALPPVDDRRWQPPVVMSNASGSCWSNDTEIWDASEPAIQCVQRDHHSGGTAGAEDCLYLNIFTPRLGKKAKLPVMVWLHGGNFDTGNASVSGFSPDGPLAKELGVVFVSIQFRLNAFGFLVLKELSNNTGNLGLLDQIAALNWIQENIATFGGDQNKVTIFGQGSGGSSVLALMVSPYAKGLFHKAWAASPSVVVDSTLKSATEYNAFFVNATRCASEKDVHQCLLSLSAPEILHAVFKQWKDSRSNALPEADEVLHERLVIDGDILPSNFKDAFESGSGINDVPLLIGNTAQEADIHPHPQEIATLENSSYVRIVQTHLDTFTKENLVAEALDYYPFTTTPASGDKGAELPYTTMVSDVRVSCLVDEVAESASSALTSPVFRYVVTAIPSRSMHGTNTIYDAKYAFHELDLMAFFGTMSSFFISGSSSNADEAFSENLSVNVMAFVESGKPYDPQWLNFNSSTALISQSTKIVEHYHKEECDMWENYGLLKYGWKA